MSARALFFTAFTTFLLSCRSLSDSAVLALSDSAVLTAAPGRSAYLRVNERMVSPSGNVILGMQVDGNLVTYKNNCVGNPSCAVWNSQTSQQQGEYFLAMQEDGNIVIYRGTPENNQGVVWQSQSDGAVGNYFLTLQDDENLVAYRGTGPSDNQGPIWSTKTGLLNKKTVALKINKGPNNSCEDGVETITLPFGYKYCWWQYEEESSSGWTRLEIAVPAQLGNNDPYYFNGIRVHWTIDNNGRFNDIPIGERGSIRGVLNVAGAMPGANCLPKPSSNRYVAEIHPKSQSSAKCK